MARSKIGFYSNIIAALINLILFFTGTGIVSLICMVVSLSFAIAFYPRTPELGQKKYDDRWNDPAYVAMVHKTRAAEAENGIILSECKCSSCRVFTDPPKALPETRTTSGEHELFEQAVRHAQQKTGAQFVKDENGRTKVYSPKTLRIVNGVSFYVPAEVPEEAEAAVVENGAGDVVSAYFSWYDVRGQKMRYVSSAIVAPARYGEAHYSKDFSNTKKSIEDDFKKALGDMGERF